MSFLVWTSSNCEWATSPIICEIAKFHGGSSHRLANGLIERLIQPVELNETDFDAVGEYLATKKLCTNLDEENITDSLVRDYRYQDIGYRKAKDGNAYLIEKLEATDEHASVWFQDYCLAQATVRSRVGAVTAKGKYGSKTGVSHLLEWAQELDLISRTGIASPVAELVAHERRFNDSGTGFSNPYVLGKELIPLGYAYIWADFDVFAQHVKLLSSISETFARKKATEVYINAVLQLTDRTENSRSLSNSQTRSIFALWRDLQQGPKKERSDNLHTKTAWHRASSRFEMLTDLGFLTKKQANKNDKYQYKYRVTEQTRIAAKTLASTDSASEWFDNAFLGIVRGKELSPEPAPPELLLAHLPPVVDALRRPTAPLPMDAVMLGLAMQLYATNDEHSMGGLREGLRQLANKQPELARISRGTTAKSAGLISFDLRKLG